MTADNFYVTSDGARIYFEDRGEGFPIVMVPGFLCTTRFFEKNAGVLAEKYRVITMDPRGQGYSSKCIYGNTIQRHAQDIRELLEYLELDHVVLLGWSLSASTVVEYAKDFKEARLSGLVVVDGSLYPASHAEWNHHRARAYDLDNWFENYLPLYSNPEEFYQCFIRRISCKGGMDEDTRQWIVKECKKTMPWSAIELHYDFIHTDNYQSLKNITVPFAAFGGSSEAYGLDMAEQYVKEVQGYSEINAFYESGHLMFLYEAEKFNRCLSNFADRCYNLSMKVNKEDY